MGVAKKCSETAEERLGSMNVGQRRLSSTIRRGEADVFISNCPFRTQGDSMCFTKAFAHKSASASPRQSQENKSGLFKLSAKTCLYFDH